LSRRDQLSESNYREGSRKAPFFRLNSYMRTTLRLLAFFAFSSVVIAISMISFDYVKTRQAFPPKTFIYNVDVSTLTKKQAEDKLLKIPISQLYAKHVSFEVEGKFYAFDSEKLGIYILYKDTVRNAFKMTHKDSYLDELKGRIKVGAVYAPLIMGVNKEQLKYVLSELAEQVNTEKKNASISFYEKTGAYHIEPEVPGRTLDIKKTMSIFQQHFYAGNKVVPVVIKYSLPQIKEAQLRAAPPINLLSKYTTYYGKHDSPNRIHNIKLISSWIDGTLLMPGESFSVVDILGDVIEEQGYKEAFVILNGELVPSLGGGACQIATTLYNAVSLADLKVLRRRSHSFYFNIYPLGRDAGVYPGSLDFTFKNDSLHPVLIKTIANKRWLSIRMYGTPTGKKVYFSSPSVLGKDDSGNYVPMSLKRVIDEDVPFRTIVTRSVYNQKGEKIKKEKIKSYYKLYGDKENVPIKRPEPR
jgi:vancomycin resistance protein YoaR